jgi:hypothetical protein
MAFSRNITVKRMFLYWIAQFAGGLCGGGILAAAVGPQNYISGIGLAESVTAGQGEHAGLLDCPSPCFPPGHILFVHICIVDFIFVLLLPAAKHCHAVCSAMQLRLVRPAPSFTATVVAAAATSSSSIIRTAPHHTVACNRHWAHHKHRCCTPSAPQTTHHALFLHGRHLHTLSPRLCG